MLNNCTLLSLYIFKGKRTNLLLNFDKWYVYPCRYTLHSPKPLLSNYMYTHAPLTNLYTCLNLNEQTVWLFFLTHKQTTRPYKPNNHPGPLLSHKTLASMKSVDSVASCSLIRGNFQFFTVQKVLFIVYCFRQVAGVLSKSGESTTQNLTYFSFFFPAAMNQPSLLNKQSRTDHFITKSPSVTTAKQPLNTQKKFQTNKFIIAALISSDHQFTHNH